MNAVRASGLTKRYEALTAVDGLDIAVAPGEVRGLLGPNGAGKTTLLRMLFGLIRPDAGSVELLGHDFDGLGGEALEEVGGFVEEPSFYPYLSGAANLSVLARLDGGHTEDAIDAVLERVGLEGRGDDRVAGYSTGMKQRLGLAAALLRSPRLLLLDEPTSGLDPAGTRAVAALVREVAADGVAVLLSSHQIGELERVCDSYTVMRHGRVVWDGSAAELIAQAPASAYALATSDDERALAARRRPRGRPRRALRPRRPGARGRGRRARRLRPRPRRRPRRRPPPRPAGEPAGDDVLRPDHRRRRDRGARARGAGRDGAGGRVNSIAPAAPAAAARPIGGQDPIWNAFRVELRKLAAQLLVRLLAIACVVCPIAFAAVLKVQSGTPNDALFGVYVHSSGFAVSLVLLSFAGNWGLPVIAGPRRRRPLRLRGSSRHLEDDPHPLRHPHRHLRRQAARRLRALGRADPAAGGRRASSPGSSSWAPTR